MTGNEYRKKVASYLVSAYWDRGIQVFEEVNVGTSIIGKQRRVDLFVLLPSERKALALECKYQDTSGTADEKIPYSLQDLAALRMPSALAYAGAGFSEGVLHLLQASEFAAYCLPDDTLRPVARKVGDSIDSGTWQLDHVLAMAFGWWDILVAGKTPLEG
ncbi:MAG TPA: PD-(D/E)XK nuclease superfamily protein [Polyangiaceae bacterium]|nr:PD-(D/E)XK nuclease superfamily protein [Polyangiaceae bacterium]